MSGHFFSLYRAQPVSEVERSGNELQEGLPEPVSEVKRSGNELDRALNEKLF